MARHEHVSEHARPFITNVVSIQYQRCKRCHPGPMQARMARRPGKQFGTGTSPRPTACS